MNKNELLKFSSEPHRIFKVYSSARAAHAFSSKRSCDVIVRSVCAALHKVEHAYCI